MIDYLRKLAAAEFLSPWNLWFFVPIGILLLVSFVRGSSRIALFIRLISLGCLTIALADPASRELSSKEELVALFDVSKSVSSKAQLALLQSLRNFIGGEKEAVINLLPFARQVARSPLKISPQSSLSQMSDAVSKASDALDSGETNLAGAINNVAGRGEDASILLLSDGLETAGNAKQAAKFAASKGIRIFPLIPSEGIFRNEGLSISSVQGPVTMNEGDLAEIRTTIKNSLNRTGSGTLEVWLDQKKLLSRNVEVNGGEEKVFPVKTSPVEGGLHRIRAVLGEGDNAKSEEHRWISVKKRSKLFLVSGSTVDERVLRQLLSLKGYSLEPVVANGNAAISTNFEDYSGIILNNVARHQLPARFLEQLKTYVDRGGGLLLAGGDHSYGLGDYINSILEEISPLKFVPPQTAKRRLNVAVEIVIDKSRSMAFEEKLEGAKTAALMAINSMKDEDYVGVIGFDSMPFVILRLGPLPEVRDIAAHRIANLTAAGKTDLLPAMATARQSLSKAPASRKHIILLSDGKVPNAGNDYLEEMERLRTEGVSLSAIALGVEADGPFMQMLSQLGRGAFYHTLDASKLPQIFLHDIKVATGEKTMKEEDAAVFAGPDGVSSTTLREFPRLKGFVQTEPKRGANLELVTRDDERQYPLLASWTYGLGHVIAFTSDSNGRWTSPWLNWDGFPKFWTELVQGIEHSPESKAGQIDFDLRYTVNRKTLYLDLAIYDDKLRTEYSPKCTAEVLLPGGEARPLTFSPEKKGKFTAALENIRPGDLHINISYRDTKLPPLAITLPGEFFGEIPGQGIDVQNLSEIAYLSGGMINPIPSQVANTKHLSKTYKHLYLPLIIAAFFLILIEAFVRELGRNFLTLFFGSREKQSSSSQQSGIYAQKRKVA